MDWRILIALIIWLVADVFRDKCAEVQVGGYYKAPIPWYYDWQHTFEFGCLWLPMFLITWAVYGLWVGLGLTMVGGGLWMCIYSWATHGNPFAPDEIFFPFMPDSLGRRNLSGAAFLIIVFTLIFGGLSLCSISWVLGNSF